MPVISLPTTIFFIAFFMMPFAVPAQKADSVPAKKPWYLTFTTDVKTKSIGGWYTKNYEGEYSATGNVNFPDWKWVKREEKLNSVLKDSRFIDIKMDVLLSKSRNWGAGLSYNFGSLQYDRKYRDSLGNMVSDKRDLSFIAITALGEYRYFLRKNQVDFNPFLFGSLAGGFYRGGAENSGSGTEWFTEGRVGFGYHFMKGWMARLWIAQNFLFYDENTYSPVFKRDQNLNIQQGLSYWGVGFSKQFTLIPD